MCRLSKRFDNAAEFAERIFTASSSTSSSTSTSSSVVLEERHIAPSVLASVFKIYCILKFFSYSSVKSKYAKKNIVARRSSVGSSSCVLLRCFVAMATRFAYSTQRKFFCWSHLQSIRIFSNIGIAVAMCEFNHRSTRSRRIATLLLSVETKHTHSIDRF